jgi:hypothetical protein
MVLLLLGTWGLPGTFQLLKSSMNCLVSVLCCTLPDRFRNRESTEYVRMAEAPTKSPKLPVTMRTGTRIVRATQKKTVANATAQPIAKKKALVTMKTKVRRGMIEQRSCVAINV